MIICHILRYGIKPYAPTERAECYNHTSSRMMVLRIAVFVLFFGSRMFCDVSPAAGEATSYSPQILQYVREDKVYLLEKLRPRVTNYSEKIVIDALLAEDGPKAARLYLKQLQEYPNPALDSLSNARLNDFRQTLSLTPNSIQSAAQLAYSLQFGSFGSLGNARELANRVASSLPVTIVQEQGLYKVRAQKTFGSRAAAEATAKTLPFNAYIVHRK